MGHYAAEMMCSTCHQCCCTCPPKPDPTLDHWYVDSDFSILTGHELEAKHAYMLVAGNRIPNASFGRMQRVGRPHFAERSQAVEHARLRLDIAIAESEGRAVRLRMLQQALLKEI